MRAPLVLKVHGFRKTWLREQHGGSGCTNACLSPWLMSHCALVQHSRDNGADLNTLEHAHYKLVERHATFGQKWWSIQTSTAMQISLWCSASSPRSTHDFAFSPALDKNRSRAVWFATHLKIFRQSFLEGTFGLHIASPPTNKHKYVRTGFCNGIYIITDLVKSFGVQVPAHLDVKKWWLGV